MSDISIPPSFRQGEEPPSNEIVPQADRLQSLKQKLPNCSDLVISENNFDEPDRPDQVLRETLSRQLPVAGNSSM